MTAVEAAWLAGIIDGEGTVTLTRKHAGENRQLALLVSSTEPELLEAILRYTTVGKVTGKRTTSPAHRPCRTYAVYNRQALDILRQVTPHLRGYKRQRSELILDCYVRLTPRNGVYSESTARLRRQFERRVLSIKPP